MDFFTVDNFAKPAVSGAVASLSLLSVFGDRKVNLMGRQMSVAVFGGALGALSSLAVEAVHKYALPHIPHNARLVNLESAALNLGTGALTFYLLPRLLVAGAAQNPGNVNRNLALIGALSEATSQLFYEVFLTGKFTGPTELFNY